MLPNFQIFPIGRLFLYYVFRRRTLCIVLHRRKWTLDKN